MPVVRVSVAGGIGGGLISRSSTINRTLFPPAFPAFGRGR